MDWLKAWFAGFLATLFFHQAVMAALWMSGAVAAPPFDLTPVAPLGVPKVMSLAFWGGVWGLPAWLVIRNVRGSAYWLRALLFGGAGPTAVALLLVFPLKGLPVTGATVVGGLLVNGAWGVGVAVFMTMLTGRFASR